MTGSSTGGEEATVYDVVGGQVFFDRLAARFYDRVRVDAVLRPLYPEDDAAFDASERWLALFLGQYWGGPPTYMEQRGHPRLRMRHAGFVVGARERDAWLAGMRAALDDQALPSQVRERFDAYFAMAAEHMINSPGA